MKHLSQILFLFHFSLILFPSSADVDIPESIRPIVEAVEKTTDWTLPELKAGLDRLDLLYQNEMKTAEGRRRWHGDVTNVTFDTNALVKIQTHADGYRYEQPFKTARAMSVGERISAAERKARTEERRRKLAEAEERRKHERAMYLTTNMTHAVQALMSSKRWPEELARLYLKNELNNLVGTNEVTFTITPQGN